MIEIQATCTRCRGDPGEEASGAGEGEIEPAQGNTAPRYGQVEEVEEKDICNDHHRYRRMGTTGAAHARRR